MAPNFVYLFFFFDGVRFHWILEMEYYIFVLRNNVRLNNRNKVWICMLEVRKFGNILTFGGLKVWTKWLVWKSSMSCSLLEKKLPIVVQKLLSKWLKISWPLKLILILCWSAQKIKLKLTFQKRLYAVSPFVSNYYTNT